MLRAAPWRTPPEAAVHSVWGDSTAAAGGDPSVLAVLLVDRRRGDPNSRSVRLSCARQQDVRTLASVYGISASRITQ